MNEFRPHHIAITADHVRGNDGRGRFFFLPGSDGRAARIAEHFSDRSEIPSDRRHTVHLGRLSTPDGAMDVGTVATGMGCPSVDIIVTELIHVGARHLLRVGTAGSLQPDRIRRGSLVIATGAVRDQSTSDRYAPLGFPALADRGMVNAACDACASLGVDESSFCGIVHTKDSLYAREFGFGPQREENQRYMDQLSELGVLASEMEAAHLFVLASASSPRPGSVGQPSVEGVRAGGLFAIVGDDRPFAADDGSNPEELVVQLALETARRFHSSIWRTGSSR
jgi:uridine phosphorylase